MSQTESKLPSFMQNNAWIEILQQRGKEDQRGVAAVSAKTTIAPKPERPDKPLSNPDNVIDSKPRRRKMKLLEASLEAYGLQLQHFSLLEIGGKLNVSSRQASRYVERGRQYLGVPEGLRNASLAESLHAIKCAWTEYRKAEDPRVKAMWFRSALLAMAHRDRLLPQTQTEKPKIQV
jgi:hypothetical protein